MQQSDSSNGHKTQLKGKLIFKPINSPDPRIALAKAELEIPQLHEPENPAAAHRKNCISLDDFHAYMPNHAYIFVPTREMWPAKSVNARIAPIAMKDARGEPVPDDEGRPKKMTASAWLDRHRPVEQMTWAPRPAGTDPRPPDLRRRVVRPRRRHGLQPVSPAAASLRRPQRRRPVDQPRPQGLRGRRQPHHPVAGAPGAAPA
jgi:hypothetical protein